MSDNDPARRERPRGAGRAREVEASLRLLLDTVEEGVLGILPDGRVAFVNAAGATALGVATESVVGVAHDVLVRPSAAGAERAECPICRVLQRGGQETVAEANFHPPGAPAFTGTYTVAREAAGGDAVVVFREVTPLWRARATARDALDLLGSERRARFEAEAVREWLFQLFERVPALVGITRGPRHVFDFANRALRETVGGRTVIGLPFAEALPEIAEQGAIGLLNDVYTTGEPYFGESDAVLMRRSDGVEERVLSRTVQRVRLPDGADGLLLHHTDITPTVHARREVERTLAELRAVTDELARSNEELDQFAYAASHDLKAPLRGINHLATWIRDDFGANLDPRALEYLDLIGTRIGHLEALIDGLLEYSRIGRSSLQLRPLDMDRVVSDIVDLVPTPPHVRVEIAGPLPVITADPIRIRQVVQNLLSNAVKYASARVEIRTERHPTRYGFEVFAISDDGPGIDPRYHDRIWGVFQRLEASDEGSGTGIGLALVRKIAREAGGDAWVRSTPGEGATFLFSWPRTRSDEEAA